MSSSPPRKRPKLALDYEESSARDEKAKATQELKSGAPSQIEISTEDVDLSTPEYSLSPFERLPLDPFARIVNYAPCSVFNLMLTSRSLNRLVNEYALMRDSSQLIERLYLKVYTKQQIEVVINVSKSRNKLAELRLNIVKAKISKRIQRVGTTVCGLTVYKLSVNIDESEELFECLQRFMGCRIGELHIIALPGNHWTDVVSKLVDGIRITKLTFEVEVLEESSCPYIVNMVKTCQVGEISLKVQKAEMNDPENCLLELANLVRSMHIQHQHHSGAVHSFFGIHRDSWARIILNMFSRKLDRLWIDNNPYGNLSVNHVRALCEQLPLMSKQIWFEAACDSPLPDSICADHSNYVRYRNGRLLFARRFFADKSTTISGCSNQMETARLCIEHQALDQTARAILALYFRLDEYEIKS